ncbi:hypothetical protein TSTA_094520 [Talaromyces stipitatus ATCC 10500]|uniref:Uncharacterized protein n=1 Tax=Talaromyces stipitatus (strain ATCC 10500 / CBS 375.48 / QM 6759 / NRRL 1006) TaxID=441959 RepID=B8M2V1_TALSN|nr:uncharacterized protein TSTA_094520 [Talaromyces stipitatus ATCC 10500]EED22206.1 hypothetical protein TSTA_094520 [Talaromyces stipitatus ATCC 10500]
MRRARGIQTACEAAGVRRVHVLCNMDHPSIMKAASLTGLGRGAVKQRGLLDIARVQKELEESDCASIVSVSVGEHLECLLMFFPTPREGRKTIRCAIANWAADGQEDLAIVTDVLGSVAKRWDKKSRL